jgi:competence protein ComEA
MIPRPTIAARSCRPLRLALACCVLLVLLPAGAVRAQAPAGAGVDLNAADAPTLARELIGIGESRARAIVEHRRRHGPFRSVDELALVRGIGPKTVERNRARLRIGSGVAAAAVVVAGAPAARNGPTPGSRGRVVGPDGAEPEIIEGMPRDGG